MSFEVQGSGAWLAQRVGKLTASRMCDAMARLKSKTLKDGTVVLGAPSEKRIGLLKELLAERLTGMALPHVVTQPMRHGIENEPFAKDEYEDATGEILVPCGFYDHPTIPDFGATPDALRGADGICEIKCPNTCTHIEWVMGGVLPEQHRPQILAQLACTGRKHALFISFDPRIPPGPQRLFAREWRPEPEEIAAVECAAREFLADLELMWEQLTGASAHAEAA